MDESGQVNSIKLRFYSEAKIIFIYVKRFVLNLLVFILFLPPFKHVLDVFYTKREMQKVKMPYLPHLATQML